MFIEDLGYYMYTKLLQACQISSVLKVFNLLLTPIPCYTHQEQLLSRIIMPNSALLLRYVTLSKNKIQIIRLGFKSLMFFYNVLQE